MPPGLPKGAIARPRLDERFARELEDHEAVAVCAAAGAGKTVQAQLFAKAHDWPLAWLTIDAGERVPSRLLTYLAAAVAPYCSDSGATLEWARGQSPVVEEVAALVAERIVDAPRLLLVLDQCEVIADSVEACSTLESFLNYLPRGVRAVLLSRSELGFTLGRMVLYGRVTRITDEDLALTLDEAERLIAARGEDPRSVEPRWSAANGWVAGVAFGRPVAEAGTGPAHDFSSYMSSEILECLDPDERLFVLETSVLDAVSLKAAISLYGPAARDVWPRIENRHIPATKSADGALVYHPCFREFLRDYLDLHHPRRSRELQQRLARMLVDAGEFEQAVDLFLALGLNDDAANAAEHASRILTRQADWETILRWVDALGAAEVRASPVLLAARIRALRGARRLDEAKSLIRQLDGEGTLEHVVAADPAVLNDIGWAMLWEPDEARELLRRYDTNDDAESVRYMLEVTSDPDPVSPPSLVPPMEVERPLSWGLLVQGRLDELMRMLQRQEKWPPRSSHTTPHPLLGLLWRGETERARRLFDQVPRSFKDRAHSDLWYFLEAWLLLVEGEATEAEVAAARAVAHSRRTGFGWDGVFEAIQARAMLSLGQVERARELLQHSIRWSGDAGLVAYVEWAAAFLGAALLHDGDDEQAASVLRPTADGMQRAARRLLLPAAAVYLAEAEARLGHDEAAAAAASTALDAARHMDAFVPLQMALAEFPGVLRRQVEAQPGVTEWHRLGATTHGGRHLAVASPEPVLINVDIQPFGVSPEIFVDGEPVAIRRRRVLELASFLALHPHGVIREQAQVQLLPDSDQQRGSNNFRQVVHQLRKATGLTLERFPDGRIGWASELHVDSVDQRFERLLAEARGVSGRERLARLRHALGLPVGPYLATSDLEWACERRYELEVLEEEAELEAAQLAVEADHFDEAERLVKSLLDRNPYSEPAYRVYIEAQLAVGSETRARAVFRRAVDALGEIGLSPTPEISALFDRKVG